MADAIRILFLSLSLFLCTPLSAAAEGAAGAALSASVKMLSAAKVVVGLCQSKIPDGVAGVVKRSTTSVADAAAAVGLSMGLNGHGNAEKRTFAGALQRHLDAKTPEGRFAMLGVDLQMRGDQRLAPYIEEYGRFMRAMNKKFQESTLLSDASVPNPEFGDECEKLAHRLRYIILACNDALYAYENFLKTADSESAEKAALYVQATQELVRNSKGWVGENMQVGFKRGRKNVREKLYTYLANVNSELLRTLCDRGFNPRCLYDSDDEVGQEKGKALSLQLKQGEEAVGDDYELLTEADGKIAEESSSAARGRVDVVEAVHVSGVSVQAHSEEKVHAADSVQENGNAAVVSEQESQGHAQGELNIEEKVHADENAQDDGSVADESEDGDAGDEHIEVVPVHNIVEGGGAEQQDVVPIAQIHEDEKKDD